jgi:hypothetical protein
MDMKSFCLRVCRRLAVLWAAGAAAHFFYVIIGMLAHVSSYAAVPDSSSPTMLTLNACALVIKAALDRLRAAKVERVAEGWKWGNIKTMRVVGQGI